MQGSLSLPQRSSMQFLTPLQSFRAFGIRSGGSCSFSHWKALKFEQPGASISLVQRLHRRTLAGVANDLPWQGTVTLKDFGFVGNIEDTRMRGLGFSSFATITSCSYKSEVACTGFRREIVTPGKPCGSVLNSSCGIRIPKQVQHRTAPQWLSRRYVGKPVLLRGCKNGGQELLVKVFGFKRVVSESDSVTTFYTSDVLPSTAGDAVEDKERTAGKKKKTMIMATEEIAGKCEDSDSESEDDELEKLSKEEKKIAKAELKLKQKHDKDILKMMKEEQKQKKGVEMAGNCEDSDSESDDEEEIFTKEEKKSTKAELKHKENLDKVILKTMKEEKRQKKEAKRLKASKASGEESSSNAVGNKKMKLDLKEKNDEESDNDSESEEEGEHNLNVKSKLKRTEDLASDSEREEEDDGVTDFGDDTPEKDEEILVMEEDEIAAVELENELNDELDGELDDLDEEDDFWDDEEGDVVVGDGGTGGGVVLGRTEWGKKALELAEQVVRECGEDLSIFAFKVSSDRVIRVRLDKLSDRYGSPTMTDIEGFSRSFSVALEEAGEAGVLPKDMDVEVSSPGAERVVRVPDDLERFKELPMYVQYMEGETDLEEKDGVLELDSLDMEAGLSVWKIANVRLNREVKGPGRPLNSKQKKWRASVPFESLKQVRLYLDV